MNNVLLMGKYQSIEAIDKESFEINIIITDNSKVSKIPVIVCKSIADSISKYCHENDLIGIKGFVDNHNDKICIVASKISFLTKN